jgi:predicted PP-loop superfamily ATPase
MRAVETELQMCVRHVAEQEDRIARQDILVERLRESRSALLDEALQLLTEMRRFLDAMHDHVVKLSTTHWGVVQGRVQACGHCPNVSNIPVRGKSHSELDREAKTISRSSPDALKSLD